jgi:hypothetical protein
MKTLLSKTLILLGAAALISGFMLLSPGSLSAQENTDSITEVEPSLTLSYLCVSGDSVILTARLYYKKDRDIIALQNAVVNFTASNEKDNRELGSAITDSTGNAVLTSGGATALPANSDGAVSYAATFAASEPYLGASGSFVAKPASLKLEFYEEDSVRFVRVNATVTGPKGAIVPLTGETIKLYVPSLFRPLPIGEISLDENGTGSVEFPATLVGDSSGNIMVMAMIEESDLYGFVEGKNTINWAIHKHFIPAERPTRELWTPVAPLWMIITLIIMLLGVWAHYVYAVIQLAKIKRSSKVDTWADKL